MASLVYATDRAPVEKSEDGEAPLLTSSDGFEFPSDDRPTKLLQGRASFKLKISQVMYKTCNSALEAGVLRTTVCFLHSLLFH